VRSIDGSAEDAEEAVMSWADFYLTCFLFGFGLSALSLLAGVVDVHLPHFDFHPGPHLHAGGHGGSGMPWFNLGTVAAFLAWFGGSGYLLTRYYGFWILITLGAATVSGLGGASVMFLFLTKFLLAHEKPLQAADFDMVGVLGRLSIGIREGGTGELIYSQEGTRRVTGARSDQGIAIPKGTEVMVTSYEKGIAYVRPWEDPLADLDSRSI
jgi:hypothetical protein